ncbi:MAG: hypothetical protein LBD17_03110 [Endomicrobium sp.]|nr:hypothetical protein [Endomicrobium sp.]
MKKDKNSKMKNIVKENFTKLKKIMTTKDIPLDENFVLPSVISSKLSSYFWTGILFSMLLLIGFIVCFITGSFPFYLIPFGIIPAIIGIFFYKYIKNKIYTEGFELVKASVIEDVSSPFSSGETISKSMQKNSFYAEVILDDSDAEDEEEKSSMLFLIPYKKGFIKTPSLVGNEVALYVLKTATYQERGDVFLIDGLLGYEII